MPKYVRGEVTKEAREELSRAAPTSASQCRRRHRAIPGAEFPEHVQLLLGDAELPYRDAHVGAAEHE